MSLTHCGDFIIDRHLAAGGMAELHLAHSQRFDGPVVVKTIQPRYVGHTRVVKMFVDEGRIAQALVHPNIVKVHDVGQADGTYYIAMEYIGGRDLIAVCRRGIEVGNFLPRPLAVSVLVQALRGLGHAHKKRGADGKPLQIVHCDVSPGNIVVSWGGTVKIVDFGIARATIQLRTEDHSVAGKYNYMAPEQIRGERVDARADLFPLGVILHETTTGRRLFRGRPEQVMRAVVDEPIARPIELVPEFPPALDAIIMRALERDPQRRWPSALAMRRALEGWLHDSGGSSAKKPLAEYMHGIFTETVQKLVESEEFGGDADEELVLERGLPRSASGLHEMPILVDPDITIGDEEEDSEASGELHSTPAAADPTALDVRIEVAAEFSDDSTAPSRRSTAPPRSQFGDEPTRPSSKQFSDDATRPSKERRGPKPAPRPARPAPGISDETTGPMPRASQADVRGPARDDRTAQSVLPSLFANPSFWWALAAVGGTLVLIALLYFLLRS